MSYCGQITKGLTSGISRWSFNENDYCRNSSQQENYLKDDTPLCVCLFFLDKSQIESKTTKRWSHSTFAFQDLNKKYQSKMKTQTLRVNVHLRRWNDRPAPSGVWKSNDTKWCGIFPFIKLQYFRSVIQKMIRPGQQTGLKTVLPCVQALTLRRLILIFTSIIRTGSQP